MSNNTNTGTIKLPVSSDALWPFQKDLSAETRPFNATLEFETGDEKHVESVVLDVPVDAHLGHIKHIMSHVVRERIEPQGSSFGFMRFRMDGSAEKLTFWQRVQDFWFRLTWRGKPLTASHFIPIWPTPSANWPNIAASA